MKKLIDKIFEEVKHKLIKEDKWNGRGETFQLLKPNKIPNTLYHVSPKSNRNGILKHGIWASIGEEYENWWNYEGPNGESPDNNDIPSCVFLTDNPHTWINKMDNSEDYDVWGVDSKKLDRNYLFLDPDSSMRQQGSYCYLDDIPPSDIKLLT